jgi:hypothetical protein
MNFDETENISEGLPMTKLRYSDARISLLKRTHFFPEFPLKFSIASLKKDFVVISCCTTFYDDKKEITERDK